MLGIGRRVHHLRLEQLGILFSRLGAHHLRLEQLRILDLAAFGFEHFVDRCWRLVEQLVYLCRPTLKKLRFVDNRRRRIRRSRGVFIQVRRVANNPDAGVFGFDQVLVDVIGVAKIDLGFGVEVRHVGLRRVEGRIVRVVFVLIGTEYAPLDAGVLNANVFARQLVEGLQQRRALFCGN